MIGATGMLGLPVVVALLELGFEVTALVRDPGKARHMLPPMTRIVAADVRQPGSLKSALEGHDAVHCNLSVAPTEKPEDFHTEAQGLDNIIDAARAANVGRVGYVSALIQDGGADDGWWVRDLWRSALLRVKASGLPHTIFYPSNVMETLAQRHVAGPLVVTAGRSLHPSYWVAGRDMARQVARAFELPGGDNREYVIQGPEAMTYDEAAHRFASASRAPRIVLKLPLATFRALGLVSRAMDFNYRVTRAILDYPEEFRAERTWRELGRPTTTIEHFARSV